MRPSGRCGSRGRLRGAGVLHVVRHLTARRGGGSPVTAGPAHPHGVRDPPPCACVHPVHAPRAQAPPVRDGRVTGGSRGDAPVPGPPFGCRPDSVRNILESWPAMNPSVRSASSPSTWSCVGTRPWGSSCPCGARAPAVTPDAPVTRKVRNPGGPRRSRPRRPRPPKQGPCPRPSRDSPRNTGQPWSGTPEPGTPEPGFAEPEVLPRVFRPAGSDLGFWTAASACEEAVPDALVAVVRRGAAMVREGPRRSAKSFSRVL